MRKYFALFLCLFIVSLILVTFAFHLPYNIDELNYLQLAWHIKNQNWQLGKDYIYMFGQQTSSLVNFLASSISMLGDGGAFRFRIVFLCFTITSIIVFCYLLKQTAPVSTTMAWIIYVLLVISTNAVATKGFEVRNEPLQVLLFAFSLLVTEFWFRTSNPFWVVILGISSSLFLWLKFTVAPYFLLIFIVSLFYSKKRILFIALFTLSALLTSYLVLHKEVMFYSRYLKDLFNAISTDLKMLLDNQGLLNEMTFQPWCWILVTILGMFSLFVVKTKARRFVLMTVLPSFVYLLSLDFKKLVFPQDFVLPVFGLSFGVAVVFQYLMMQGKRLALHSLSVLLMLVILLNLKSTNDRIEHNFLPEHPNPFILYHHYFNCSRNQPLSLMEFKKCFYELLDGDHYNYTRYRRGQQEALVKFIRNWTASGDLSASSSMLNIFSSQSRAWLPARALAFEYKPYYILKYMENIALMRHEEIQKAAWGGVFKIKNNRLYYDFYSDLKSNAPKLIVADAFITERLVLDEQAAEFIEGNYFIIYHLPSQSFVGVHKLLGRKLLKAWEETRLAENEADRLIFMAIERKGDPIKLAYEALSIAPDHPEANFIIGQHLFKSGRLKEASDYLVKAAVASKFKDADALKMALNTGALDKKLAVKFEKKLHRLLFYVNKSTEALYTRSQ